MAAHQRQQPLAVEIRQRVSRDETVARRLCSKFEHLNCVPLFETMICSAATLSSADAILFFVDNKWNCLHFSTVSPLSEEEGLFFLPVVRMQCMSGVEVCSDL